MTKKQRESFRKLLVEKKRGLAEAYNKNKNYGRLTDDGVDMLVDRLPHVDDSDIGDDRDVLSVIGPAIVAPIVELVNRTVAEADDLHMPSGWTLGYDADLKRVVTKAMRLAH